MRWTYSGRFRYHASCLATSALSISFSTNPARILSQRSVYFGDTGASSFSTSASGGTAGTRPITGGSIGGSGAIVSMAGAVGVSPSGGTAVTGGKVARTAGNASAVVARSSGVSAAKASQPGSSAAEAARANLNVIIVL